MDLKNDVREHLRGLSNRRKRSPNGTILQKPVGTSGVPRVQDLAHDGWLSKIGLEFPRRVFDRLWVRMCPRLQEIYLKRWSMNLSFQGGHQDCYRPPLFYGRTRLVLEAPFFAFEMGASCITSLLLSYSHEPQRCYRELSSSDEMAARIKMVERGPGLDMELTKVGQLAWVNTDNTSSFDHKETLQILPKWQSFWIECREWINDAPNQKRERKQPGFDLV
ncbi:MAG: hypothetical protein J3R72DRAFT_497928 [Linnemannia gamsii]|nr:MAG: hypothetical protein J3R72DRAFT_497928 [Linnemannia gamsii]